MSDNVYGIATEDNDLAALEFRKTKELRLEMVDRADHLPQTISQALLDLAARKGYQITCGVRNDRLWVYDPDDTRLPNKVWRQS